MTRCPACNKNVETFSQRAAWSVVLALLFLLGCLGLYLLLQKFYT
ncbi:MAG: hypothetical protein AB1705_17785 [Verrucomicrobiota bacterium]